MKVSRGWSRFDEHGTGASKENKSWPWYKIKGTRGQKKPVISPPDMRLEKTLQAISSVGRMINERHEPGPSSIVISVSTVAASVQEFSRWLPEMFLFVLLYRRSFDATNDSAIRL